MDGGAADEDNEEVARPFVTVHDRAQLTLANVTTLGGDVICRGVVTVGDVM